MIIRYNDASKRHHLKRNKALLKRWDRGKALRNAGHSARASKLFKLFKTLGALLPFD
jgi:hypothetical protein